jgi:hypothetical protein
LPLTKICSKIQVTEVANSHTALSGIKGVVMNIFKRQCIYALLFFLSWNRSFSQNINRQNYPEIGKRCPDFILHNLQHYSQSHATLNDFNGKWLILDFWTRYCSTCVASFRETDTLAKIFKGKIEFILVGFPDNYATQLYEKVRNRYNLELPVAYDTALFDKFAIPSVPHLVWIDNHGVVKAITTNEELSVQNLNTFLKGQALNLPVKMNSIEKAKKLEAFDFRKPFLTNGNGGEDTNFQFRSILSNWTPDFSVISYESDYFRSSPFRPNELLALGCPLFCLYEMAYGDTIPHRPLVFNPPRVNNYGKYWVRPLLEMKDTSAFDFDYSTGKNLYCYNLTVPYERANSTYMQSVMQRDLKNYFGFAVKVQDRVMPCLFLVATDEARRKLGTKGGVPAIAGDGITYQVLVNQPISVLISVIWGQNQDEPPIIDQTGIKDNIDITIDAFMGDMSELKRALQKQGLDLIRREKEMKVIIISDN